MVLVIAVFSALLSVASSGISSSLGSGHLDSLSPDVLFEWNILQFNNPQGRGLGNSVYNLTQTFISGIELADERFFFAVPQVYTRVRTTLTYLPRRSAIQGVSRSPLLQPYPNLKWHTFDSNNIDASACQSTLISVFGIQRDSCNRLWVLDAGTFFNFLPNQTRICPPKIVIFQLPTDQLVKIINIPENVLTPGSSLSKIVVDNQSRLGGRGSGSCDNAYVYMADSTSPSAVIVYNALKNNFYRISHPTMYPEPGYDEFIVDGESFRSFLGVAGMDVANVGSERRLFYTPVSSLKVYSVPTSQLQQGPLKDPSSLDVKQEVVKPSQGLALHTDLADQRILLNPVSTNKIVEYNPVRGTLSTLIYDSNLIKFVRDMVNDIQDNRIVYAIVDRTAKIKNKSIDPSQINFRVLQLS